VPCGDVIGAKSVGLEWMAIVTLGARTSALETAGTLSPVRANNAMRRFRFFMMRNP
jgi:hypothetical protein